MYINIKTLLNAVDKIFVGKYKRKNTSRFHNPPPKSNVPLRTVFLSSCIHTTTQCKCGANGKYPFEYICYLRQLIVKLTLTSIQIFRKLQIAMYILTQSMFYNNIGVPVYMHTPGYCNNS